VQSVTKRRKRSKTTKVACLRAAVCTNGAIGLPALRTLATTSWLILWPFPAVAWAVWWHVKAEGALVFVKACEMGPGGDRVEAGRQPLPERDEPQLAEVPEPGVSARG